MIRLIVNSHFGRRFTPKSGYPNKTNPITSKEVSFIIADARQCCKSDRRTPDLTPFWKSNDTFHRSTDDPVRDFIQFKANYPEFIGLEKLGVAERKVRIQAKVNALYDPDGCRHGITVKVAAPTTLDATFAFEALTAPRRLVRIRVKKFQLKQGFTILIFLGSVPDDVAQWRSSSHLVGSHSGFVNSDPERCVNCRENADLITEGFIDMGNALERMDYSHKSEQEIEEFIHDKIDWRIQKVSS
jgi:Tyosinase C-terminal domain